MRRRALPGLMGTVLAAGLALGLAACGTAGSRASTSRSRPVAPPAANLTVTPRVGGPMTIFMLRFTAPVSSGVRNGSRLAYELSLAGPGPSGCPTAEAIAVPAAVKGQAVTIPLDPPRRGGRWCQGTYTARVAAVQRPVCAPGVMCPQLIRVVGTVGEVRFQVRGVA